MNSVSYSIRETREELSRLVELASLTGKRFVITKFGKPKAAIVPVPKDLLAKKKSLLDYAGFMGPGGESGIEIENRIRRNKREKEYIMNLRKGK